MPIVSPVESGDNEGIFMIAFQTLLLGLAFGVQRVGLMVAPQVSSVEVLLDDITVVVLHEEPWTFQCDLGAAPHPHELVAVARDGSGREIGRARQWLNMPRPLAEATLLLERGAQPGQVVAARLAWNEAKGTEPLTVRVTLDGKVLTVGDPRRFVIPPVDSRQAHLLSAELTFAEGRAARADAAFGGDLGDEAQSQLTAVPLVLEPGTQVPVLADMQTWFRDGDAPLRVLGVEEGPFDVAFILDQAVWKLLATKRAIDAAHVTTWNGLRLGLPTFDTAGRSDNRLFFGIAVPQVLFGNDGFTRAIFPTYEPVEFVAKRFRARLSNLNPALAVLGTQMLADAAASMGALAAASNRPRAVVLLLAGSRDDASTIPPSAARAYLEDMHVPVHVWSLLGGGDAGGGWGPAEDVSSDDLMDKAAGHLERTLRAQCVVWLDGAHLPQRVRLYKGGSGVRLAP